MEKLTDPDSNLGLAAAAARQLIALIDDPQKGLITWNMAVGDTMHTLKAAVDTWMEN